jgi:carboxyl-terminal processing protease
MGAQTFGKGSVQTVRQLSPETALKITTARYYTPSGASIQAKGIVPDVMLDETAEGNLFASLRVREADLEKHLQSGQGAEQKDAAREKAREDARKRSRMRPPSAAARSRRRIRQPEDFQLAQALNRLKGKTVMRARRRRAQGRGRHHQLSAPAPAQTPVHRRAFFVCFPMSDAPTRA